ncbi:MAG: hypothetical protein ABMA13_01550 [Chthoniobacteraceae bacterium]
MQRFRVTALADVEIVAELPGCGSRVTIALRSGESRENLRRICRFVAGPDLPHPAARGETLRIADLIEIEQTAP